MPQIQLTPAQRKVHRAEAHHLDPVVMIGNDGLTPAVVKETDAALKAHGLIKIRVLGDDRAAREAMYNQLADVLSAAPIQHIGKLLVLWRPLPEKEKSVSEDRMAGHGSTAGMMAYGDANAVAMEIGEYEVLPVVEEIPVICGVHATDPRRRMWHWLGKVKDMGFSGINNFPTHTIIDGKFRQILEETGMSVKKEFETVALARKMEMFTIVYVGSPEE